MKLASEGQLSTGMAPNAAATRPRSSATSATRASISSVYRRASRPASCVWVDRWYGSTTASQACTTSGSAMAYPSRAPAMAHVLENVRVTTRPGCWGPRKARALHWEN